MSTAPTYDPKATDDYGDGDYPEPEGIGWLTFAAIMLGLAGLYNFFAGIAAAANSHVYTRNAHYVFGDLRTWGWIIMILGILELVATFAIFTGSQFFRWFGILAAGLNSLGQLMWFDSYPGWALLLFSVDVLVIYSLARYAGPAVKKWNLT